VHRAFGVKLVLMSLLAFAVAGCPQTPQESPAQGVQPGVSVLLKLPASPKAYYKEDTRIPKLTVNGKKEPVEIGPAKEITVVVDGAATGKTVKIVYDYWPYGYSNTIRTKTVKLEAGKKIEVDFHKEDADHPDMIKPIFVPTPQGVVDEMCRYAAIGKDDVVYDIGCGDGRIVITGAKKFGARRGVGVDIDIDLIKKCKEDAAKAGVADKVEFRHEDALLMKDLSDATVVLLYVGEDFGAKLEPVLRKTLKPGSRVVSHRFTVGNWKPDEEKKITAKSNSGEDADYVLKKWTIK
jgi:hypothetical protein